MENTEIQYVQNDALSIITKAEIDVQITTAKAFPRSVTQSIEKAISLATLNQDVAESCTYALPRGGKAIEGPSVRLAEIVASSFGNIRTGARVIANDGKTITAQGVCHDLETNNLVTVEVKRRITNKKGETFNEDMQVVTGNAACAIAFRNAVFKVIPAALIESVYDEVKKVARGSSKTLVERRTKAIEYFSELGVSQEQICNTLGIKKVDDIDLDLLQRLAGFRSAIKNGDATIENVFSPKEMDRLKVDKNLMSQIVAGIEMGTTTLSQIAETYDLTEQQHEELERIENEIKSRKSKD